MRKDNKKSARHFFPHKKCQALLLLLLLSPPDVSAQASNGAVTVTHEAMVSGGGQVGGGNPMSAITVLGQPIGGSSVNGTYGLVGGSPTTIRLPAGTKNIIVEGTVDDSTASVVVNGIQAVITGTSFRAEGVQIVEGPNTITITATDPAGNRASQSITVHLDTQPPARPTVATTPAVTIATSYTLTGTKTAGTSIWINGSQVVPLGDATTWSVTVNLAEGDNTFVIVTKDAAGNQSATNTITTINIRRRRRPLPAHPRLSSHAESAAPSATCHPMLGR